MAWNSICQSHRMMDALKNLSKCFKKCDKMLTELTFSYKANFFYPLDPGLIILSFTQYTGVDLSLLLWLTSCLSFAALKIWNMFHPHFCPAVSYYICESMIFRITSNTAQ